MAYNENHFIDWCVDSFAAKQATMISRFFSAPVESFQLLSVISSQ